jgi:hypothetical protein
VTFGYYQVSSLLLKRQYSLVSKMSGRGGGCGNFCSKRNVSGRGRKSLNSSGNSSEKTPSKPSKKCLSDYIFYRRSSKQAADFKTTNAYIINHIKKMFNFGNNIGTSLETTLEDYNIKQHKPKLRSRI